MNNELRTALAYPAAQKLALLLVFLCTTADAQQSEHQYFMDLYRDSVQIQRPAPLSPGYSIARLTSAADTSKLTREIFGYLPYWFRDRWNLLDYNLVSTIAYFSGEAASDGSIGDTHGWPKYAGDPAANAHVINMINAAHANGVRVVLCITNFDGNSLHTLVSDPANRARFIEQTLAIVQAGNGDGININFEGIQTASRDYVTQFMHELADSFHTNIPGSQVSCAPTDYDTRAGDWDIAAIDPFIDLFFFQGYGYGWSGSSTTRPVGLLPNTSFWGSLNITTLIDFVLARIPPTKVLLGLPHYGRRWPAVSGDPKASTTGTGVAFYYPDAVGYIASYGRQWDNLALNPWFRYQAAGQWYQGWYDDPESMSHKYQFALNRNLAGIGMWALGMDGSNHDIWDVIAQYFADSTFVLPPKQPTLSVVKDTSDGSGGKAQLRWTTTFEPNLGGFRLYVGIDASSPPSMLLYDESVLNASTRSVLVTGLSLDTTYYFRLVAVDTDGTLISDPTDTYGVGTGSGVRYLIVDGFSRTSASYNLPYHNFNTYYAVPLAAVGRRFDSADNDAVTAGTVDLSQYAGVFWFVGDNSVADRSFNLAEQQIISSYLEGGGKLFATGSEIGFDIGRDASANYNPTWYQGYLKASYDEDDAGVLAFSGAPGSIFDGVSGQFGQTYPEDYPDYFSPVGGSSVALKYTASLNAAIQYEGTFGGGSTPGKVVYVGFAVETIASLATRTALMGRTVTFFEGTTSAGQPESIPSTFALFQNYPNPFNPTTTIEFDIPERDHIRLTIHDVLGREVRILLDQEMNAGRHRFRFDAHALPAGTYFYTLQSGSGRVTRKMALIR